MGCDVFVLHGGNRSETRRARQAAQDQKSNIRGQRFVRRGNTEMRARELSVLDCLLMGAVRSWELAGPALSLAGMAGRNAYLSTLHVPIVD